MKRKVLCLLCIFAFMLCGCVPTPDEEYVVNKGDNEAEKAVEATAAPSESSAPFVFPERWEDDILTESGEVVIDAVITGADMEQFPVRAVEKRSFTATEIAAAANSFFNDMTGLQKGSDTTREELETALETVKGSDLPPETKAEQISELKRRAETTRTTDAGFSEREEFTAEDFSRGREYSYLVRRADGPNGSLSATSAEFYFSRRVFAGVQPKSLLYLDDGRVGGGYAGEKDPSFEVTLPLETAMDAAEEFMSGLGAKGFVLASCEEARFLENNSIQVISTGYQLKFYRTFGYSAVDTAERDAANSYVKSIGSVVGDDDYSFSWRYEVMTVYVSENGIEFFDWRQPLEDEGTANENVTLMDFDELSEIIKRYFKVRLAYPDHWTPLYYRVEEMVLSTVPVRRKNSDGAYMMPVWILKIGCYHSKADENYTGKYMPGEQVKCDWCIMAFNAIDGSRAVVAR